MACPAKLPRTLKRGMKGDDVLAMKYALKKAGFGRALVMSRKYGSAVQYQVRRFQKKHHLHVDGKIGPATWMVLKRYAPPYACWLLNHFKIATPSVAATIVKTALYGYAHRGSIHYTQGSLRWQGISQKLKPPAFPRWADCSSFATWCYWVAGAPDPNGLGYRAGYTGTMAGHGHAVASPKPGDLVLYGRYWPYEHVAVYVGDGMVVSHGSESGPLHLPVHYRGDVAQYRRYV